MVCYHLGDKELQTIRSLDRSSMDEYRQRVENNKCAT